MYGWFVLFGLIIMAMVWNRLKPYMRRLLKKREEAQEYEAYSECLADTHNIYLHNICLHEIAGQLAGWPAG